MGILQNWRRSSRFKWVLFVVMMGMAAVATFVVLFLYDFLAVSHPVGEGILVVESWIRAQTLAESPAVFNSGHYRYLILVDGQTQGNGSESSDPITYNDLAAERLEKLGFDTKKIVKISAPPTVSTTLGRATAVKRWLTDSGTSVCCVDVFTGGVHARKSWVLFRHALGDRYRVGIISGEPRSSYHRKSWFLSATGIRLVVRNLAGYVYAKFLILFN